jgi:hypothetical protein
MISIFYQKENLLKKIFINLLKLFLNLKKKNLGPKNVFINLIEGLRNYGIKYNVNPNNDENVYKICMVLSGIDNLKKCIILKKKNKIKTLLAGPNLVTVPSEYNYIIFSKSIDKILVPSDWVKKMYLRYAENCKNISIWFSGVKLSNFKNKNRNKVLIYLKRKNVFFDKCINFLKENNINFQIIEYGFFSQKKYRELLRRSRILIYFSYTESQGLAMQEAWSENVTTLVYKQSYWTYNNRNFKASSSPYLNKNCGEFFKNFNEFKRNFNYHYFDKRLNPRGWFNENMSQNISIRNLLKIINL